MKYAIIIEWSDEDNKYIVTLPEFPNGYMHGSSYEEALRNGMAVREDCPSFHLTISAYIDYHY